MYFKNAFKDTCSKRHSKKNLSYNYITFHTGIFCLQQSDYSALQQIEIFHKYTVCNRYFPIC